MSGLFSSDSSASAPSKITDARAVVDSLGIAVTGNKSKAVRDNGLMMEKSSIGGNLIVSDQGAIAAAFDFAKATSTAAAEQFGKILNTGQGLVEQGATMQDTTGQSQKTLIIGGGLLLALFALWAMNK